MGRVVHFEVPVEDAARAREFYSSTFGWEFGDAGGEQYWLATTGGQGEAGIDGALIGRSEVHAAPVVIVGVDSVDEVLARADRVGTEVLLRKRTIPGVGYSAYLRDSEGNVVGVFEPAGER